jgi:hypothetical protein
MAATNTSQHPPAIGSIPSQQTVAIQSTNEWSLAQLFSLQGSEQGHVLLLAVQPQTIPHNGIYIQSNIYFNYPRHLLHSNGNYQCFWRIIFSISNPS